MKLKSIVPQIPLIVLSITLCKTLFDVSTTSAMLMDKHYFAILFTGISIALVIWGKQRKYGKIATMATLVIGALNFIGFTTAIESWFLGIADVAFHVQPYSFVLLLLFIWLHWKSIFAFLGVKIPEL